MNTLDSCNDSNSDEESFPLNEDGGGWRDELIKELDEKKQKSTGIATKFFYSHHNRELNKENTDSNVGSVVRRGNDDIKSSASVRYKLGLPREVAQVILGASQRVEQAKQNDILTHKKLQRSAFREALGPFNRKLEVYSLQEPALINLTKRLQEHLRLKTEDLAKEDDHQLTTSYSLAVKFVKDSLIEYNKHSSDLVLNVTRIDASSGSSIKEPKRTKRGIESGAKFLADRPSRQSVVPGKDFTPRKSTAMHQYKMDFEKQAKWQTEPEEVEPIWSMEPRVFAKELSSTGNRSYIVSSYGRFVDYYWRKCLPTNRHYYELIRDQTPCRLYFDLEFQKSANPELANDPKLMEQLMTEFINELLEELELSFGSYFEELAHKKSGNSLCFSFSRRDIVDLDSSTPKKFSRHLIVHLPFGALFANAIEVGIFVKNFVSRVAGEQANGLMLQRDRKVLAKYFLVNSAPPQKEGELMPRNVTFF